VANSDACQAPARKNKPPASTVPFDRDTKFVGRQDVLQALESKLSPADSHNRVVLVGLGGVGYVSFVLGVSVSDES
jgi:hypothetical protein